MPKGKRKGKFEHRRTEQVSSSDEDAGIDLTVDKYSETSSQSDLKSNHDDAVSQFSYYVKELEALNVKETKGHKCGWIGKPSEVKEEDELASDENSRVEVCARPETEALEKLEEKVLEAVDGLTARAAAARASSLVALRAALQRRPLAHVLASHRATLADHIARALRRGRDAEKRAAAAISPLLALQIGSEGCEEFVREVRPALAVAAVDRGSALETRTECCQSLAVLCYVLEEDLTEILEVMQVYETIFSGSYLKGDGSVKVSGAAVEEGPWHAAALDGWALLLPLLGAAHARSTLKNRPPGLRRIVDLLEAYSLEIRMAAGGALAIVHETLTAGNEEALESEERLQLERALPLLEQLARDSHKYRAKRDRKLQRATFRDILKYFEEDEVPCLSVRVGAESVSCETWGARAAYGSLASTLGAGLQTLAPASLELRAALMLGDPPLHPPLAKLNKLQRHLQNAAACKARTLARNKNRDKRSATLAL